MTTPEETAAFLQHVEQKGDEVYSLLKQAHEAMLPTVTKPLTNNVSYLLKPQAM